jgi:glutamate N-acetyltransferase/amino-acid N-acetyltransferase
MNKIIYTPKGFQLSALHCGLKVNEQKDLAVILSDRPCQVAAGFTTNKVKAAPVIYDQKIVNSGKKVRAVTINAGNANACTGDAGLVHTQQVAEEASKLFDGVADEVLVLSTGVIGVPLPVEKIFAGLEKVKFSDSADSWHSAAKAIMTTDTKPKIVSLQSENGYSITGIAKGAGMICPTMATMLSIICTDASLSDELLSKVSEVWGESFNRIVVDGDMSTNDTVLLLANGAAEFKADIDSDFYSLFTDVCVQLAKKIVADGEGATKLVKVNINGAKNKEDAETIARSIATSPLCKTAFYGADPNWGRIICAAGYANAYFSPEQASLFLKKDDDLIKLFEYGQGSDYSEKDAVALMENKEWEILLELNLGSSNYWLWTCDLSHDYVTINGHYRT